MNLFEQILALLVAKFQGTRKDGLEVLAQALSQTNETIEEAQAVVNKMTPEKVASFIKDWRKSADAEITKAKDTYKAGLEEKYNFVEKGKEEPGKQTPPAGEMTPEKIAEMVKAAVKEATAGITEQVAGITGAQLAASRKAQLEGIFTDSVPESFKKAILDGFEGRTFENDEAFNTYLSQQKESVAAFTKELAEKGLAGNAAPLFGKAGADGVSSSVASYIQDKAAEAKGEAAGLGGKTV